MNGAPHREPQAPEGDAKTPIKAIKNRIESLIMDIATLNQVLDYNEQRNVWSVTILLVTVLATATSIGDKNVADILLATSKAVKQLNKIRCGEYGNTNNEGDGTTDNGGDGT